MIEADHPPAKEEGESHKMRNNTAKSKEKDET